MNIVAAFFFGVICGISLVKSIQDEDLGGAVLAVAAFMLGVLWRLSPA